MPAQHNLAVMYSEGTGVAKNHKEAFKLFKPLAEQGIPESQSYLSRLYYSGLGTAENHNEAFKWMERAAMQGYSNAQFFLALYYKVDRNFLKAYVWMDIHDSIISLPMLEKMKNKLAKKLSPEDLIKAQKISSRLIPKVNKRKESLGCQTIFARGLIR